MLRKIILHGPLADEFGKTPIELDVDSPQMLLSGLFCVLDGFEDEFRKNSHFQIAKVDRNNKLITSIGQDAWGMTFGNAEEIHLMPEVEGGAFEAAAYILGAAAVGTMGYYVLGTIISIALSYAMSAISQSLSPSPSANEAVSAAQKPSFIFSQAVNVTQPGLPVQLVYGECLVGSVVISAGVETEQLL